MSSQAIIKAVGLTKVFRDFWRRARVRAVNDLDLEIQSGEVYGLLGPNGSGKSTTIKMVLGLLHPSRGRVSIFGKPPDDVRTKARIGYLPEESYLYRFLNARETLDYYGTLFRIERPARRKRIEELLEMVGLRSAARRPVGEYSKGMARRIGLAQALINDPDLLILDEPTSGLDPVGSKLVKDIIQRLGDVYKKTIVLSSHLLADVEEVCNRVTILYGGRVQESGNIEDVLAREDMTQITAQRLDPATLEEVARLIRSRENKDIEITTPRDRLEALFLRIVEEAQRKRVETAGTTAAGEIAGFLGAQSQAATEAAGRQMLEQLQQPEAPEPEPVQPAPEPPSRHEVDQDVLGDLTGTAPEPADSEADPSGAAPAGQPTEPRPISLPPRDVDQGLLDELSGGQSQEQDDADADKDTDKDRS